jgi:hypothetical protein
VTKERGKIYTAPGLIDKATGLPQKFTTKEMLMLAGNMGNESNAAKMAKGERWDQAAVWDFLNANMTPAHWDFVEGMGRTLESCGRKSSRWTAGSATPAPRRSSRAPSPRPTARPAAAGTGRSCTTRRAARTWPSAARARATRCSRTSTREANTDTGRMNTRNENYARPLLLDLDALPRMIKDEIHDISHREAVIDADRFLSHPTVRKCHRRRAQPGAL